MQGTKKIMKRMYKRWRQKRAVTDVDGQTTGFQTTMVNGEPSANLRALRLALTISDQLLSMNIPASNVVTKALDVTEAYCKQPVHIDIMSNLIMLSQLRDVEEEPLTLIRPTVPRTVNNMTVQSIQDLVYRIRSGKVDLYQAEAKLQKILKNPVSYPRWVHPIAAAGIASGVGLMFTTNWRIILITFVISYLVEQLLSFLYKNSLMTFFRQAAAAAVVTTGAAVVNMLAKRGVEFFSGMNPTLIVVGGIIMLLSGLAIVGAIQDAIDEYYVTANARILKVLLLTSGIVMGVLIGLYIARKFNIGIAVSAEPLKLTSLKFQMIGGGVASVAFAIVSHTRLRSAVWAGLLGSLAVFSLYWVRSFGVAAVPATGIAALFVGMIAKSLSRVWHTPAAGMIAAGIIPLVPGLALYNGLMQLVNYPPTDPLFYKGVGTLFTAIATALAIAAGASFGNMMARPLSQRATHVRNFTPFLDYMMLQLKSSGSRRSNIAKVALRRSTEYIKHTLTEPKPEDADDADSFRKRD